MMILHSPVLVFFQALLLSQLFAKGTKCKIFGNLLLGAATHLILDAGQRAFHYSYVWLFPFSLQNPIKGIWWYDEGGLVQVGMIFIGVVVWFIRRRKIKE